LLQLGRATTPQPTNRLRRARSSVHRLLLLLLVLLLLAQQRVAADADCHVQRRHPPHAHPHGDGLAPVQAALHLLELQRRDGGAEGR
jgi:hypothetical protein